ncbi:uncharacterized protein C5L36_0E03500 [Pichia kudriavzevii]|uniref:ATPase expression protein 2, mitochondrial n=1 Tax=Pichia kudriavzevii TaxID=4909 RepID=A0A099P5M3_PICKU|nr:uncharacterized protein C5L36_0E03500 [Pichia kudriavzevii]AWU78292.1 hypothetical protein C5L36_0E03500 [Pichia kudriavzevii]KGK39512.1 hypothetical protein JL09_g1340 [Pichia kudriavzevii]ONH77693.1 ATPase expression protein 2, mitochondrial [Pichia kudriavzevii]
MLRGYKVASSHVRGVAFFVPSNRINEYSKRELQENATIELFEDNYKKLKHYYEDRFPDIKFKNVKTQKTPFAKFSFKPNDDTVVAALDSVNIDFFQNINEKIPVADDVLAERDFRKMVKLALYNTKVPKLYNLLKCNLSRISTLKDELTPSDVSVIIRRLISYHDMVSKSAKFMTKNRKYLYEDNESYVTRLNEISDSLYTQNTLIFNACARAFDLSISDYEEIVMFHYRNGKIPKTVEIIAGLEKKAQEVDSKLYLSNKLWFCKLDILSKTSNQFWKIYGEKLFRNEKKVGLKNNYLYPHHGHNFQILLQRYEHDKSINNLPDDADIINVIIKGLGKHCDIPSLDKLIESYWGIKIDRISERGVYLMEHFNIRKNVNALIWPNEKIITSILLSYATNGDVATGIMVNNMILEKYNDKRILNSLNTIKYWEFVLRCVGLYGDATEKNIARLLNETEIIDDHGNSLLEIKYRFFDIVSNMSERFVRFPTREMFQLKIRYSSSHEILNGLPIAYKQLNNDGYNHSRLNYRANQHTLYKYVEECCKELGNRGLFLDAKSIIEKYITSKQETKSLKDMLGEMQEIYARKRVKEDERKRRVEDEDDDFQLW